MRLWGQRKLLWSYSLNSQNRDEKWHRIDQPWWLLFVLQHSAILVSPSARMKPHQNTAGFLLLGPWQKSKGKILYCCFVENRSRTQTFKSRQVHLCSHQFCLTRSWFLGYGSIIKHVTLIPSPHTPLGRCGVLLGVSFVLKYRAAPQTCVTSPNCSLLHFH